MTPSSTPRWTRPLTAVRDSWLPIIAVLSCVCLFVSMADAGPTAAPPATPAAGSAVAAPSR